MWSAQRKSSSKESWTGKGALSYLFKREVDPLIIHLQWLPKRGVRLVSKEPMWSTICLFFIKIEKRHQPKHMFCTFLSNAPKDTDKTYMFANTYSISDDILTAAVHSSVHNGIKSSMLTLHAWAHYLKPKVTWCQPHAVEQPFHFILPDGPNFVFKY